MSEREYSRRNMKITGTASHSRSSPEPACVQRCALLTSSLLSPNTQHPLLYFGSELAGISIHSPLAPRQGGGQRGLAEGNSLWPGDRGRGKAVEEEDTDPPSRSPAIASSNLTSAPSPRRSYSINSSASREDPAPMTSHLPKVPMST